MQAHTNCRGVGCETCGWSGSEELAVKTTEGTSSDLFSPLTGERLRMPQVVAAGFTREAIQRSRPIPEDVGREILRPTPSGNMWALLVVGDGRAWFPVERVT